jgi:hypothetical protein
MVGPLADVTADGQKFLINALPGDVARRLRAA